MSAPERQRAGGAVRGRPGQFALTIGALLALYTAQLPLLKVIEPGPWVAGAFLMPAAVLAAGFVARWYRLPAVAVSLTETAVWVVLVMLVFFPQTGVLGVIPTADTFSAVPETLRGAMDQIVLGTAPLPATADLSALLVGAVGLLAIVIDHVVLTARLPLIAAIGLVAVSLIPAIAVPDAFDMIGFAMLAAAILFLIRTETRTRAAARSDAGAGSMWGWAVGAEGAASTSGAGAGGASAAAIGIGAVAVIVAIVATPLLPPPGQSSTVPGGTVSINATLALGNDLRRPADIQVLTVRTSAPAAPYLRVATLSSFNGKVWLPDDDGTVGVTRGFGDVTVPTGVQLTSYTTEITVGHLTTQYLPVPFPAVKIDGVDTPWTIMRGNRTVLAPPGLAATSEGLTYEVLSDVPEPTLEQVRAASARLGSDNPYDASLPPKTPADIGALAREVTSGTDTDYDALVALQDWFRGPAFTYSLTAPVTGGFDTSGIDSVEAFLKVKKGYCIHFASAFAIMARELGMASRVVVGYLPGIDTRTVQNGQEVYSVSSSQLHAWPEVYFRGLGWVSFDPTKDLGSPTDFLSATAGTGKAPSNESAVNTPTPTSSASPNARSNGRQLGEDNNIGTVTPAQGALPWAFTGILVVLALMIPGVLGALRRRRQDAAARDGDAASAWASVQETAIDLGIAVPGTESARAFGTRLVRTRRVPADAMGMLVGAIERASYAENDAKWYWRDAELPEAATDVRMALLRSATGGRRLVALAFPRSLIVKPGSVYAGTVEPTGAGTGPRAR